MKSFVVYKPSPDIRGDSPPEQETLFLVRRMTVREPRLAGTKGIMRLNKFHLFSFFKICILEGMKNIEIPEILRKVNKIFTQNGYEAFLVGGAVRDLILGKPASDYDIATNAKPEDVIRIFNKVIPTGIAHGTVTILFMGQSIEATTYRIEKDYSDGRHPDKVEYASKIEEDLSRRDFTMNAIAASLADGQIVDPFGGQIDIENKVIRTVGNPLERFSEDGLRPVRALRFAAQLGFDIEEETLKAIPATNHITKNISIERFRDEFVKALKSKKPSIAINLMEKTGILEMFLPELLSCRNVIQKDIRDFHTFDVLDHLIYALDGVVLASKNQGSVELRLATLFHDIGKPDVKKVEERLVLKDRKEVLAQINTFHSHEFPSAKIAKNILTRLRFPNNTIKYVCHLIENHMFHYESTWQESAIRRFIAKHNTQELPFATVCEDLFFLRQADAFGKDGDENVFTEGKWIENLSEFKGRIDKELEKQVAFSLKDLAVSGRDLIEVGFPAGKQMGNVLNQLLEKVLENPEINTKEVLLDLAKEMF